MACFCNCLGALGPVTDTAIFACAKMALTVNYHFRVQPWPRRLPRRPHHRQIILTNTDTKQSTRQGSRQMQMPAEGVYYAKCHVRQMTLLTVLVKNQFRSIIHS